MKGGKAKTLKFRVFYGKKSQAEWGNWCDVSSLNEALKLARPTGPHYQEDNCYFGVWLHRVYQDGEKLKAPIWCWNSPVREYYVLGEFMVNTPEDVPKSWVKWDSRHQFWRHVRKALGSQTNEWYTEYVKEFGE